MPTEISTDSQSKPSRRRPLLVALAGIPLLAAGLFMAPGTASAAPDDGANGRGGRMCAKLKCSDDQKEELRAIFAEMREDAKGDHEAIERLRGQMKAEFAKDAPDEEKLRNLQAQIATHRNELASRRLDAMLDVHEVLDAEQRKSFMDMMEKRRGKHDKRKKAWRNKKGN